MRYRNGATRIGWDGGTQQCATSIGYCVFSRIDCSMLRDRMRKYLYLPYLGNDNCIINQRMKDLEAFRHFGGAISGGALPLPLFHSSSAWAFVRDANFQGKTWQALGQAISIREMTGSSVLRDGRPEGLSLASRRRRPLAVTTGGQPARQRNRAMG